MTVGTSRRRQDTFTWQRMMWPYVWTSHEDGRIEVEVQDAICPRCRGRARRSQSGDTVLLECRPCGVSEFYPGFASYDELKAHVAGLVLEKLKATG